MIEIFINGNLTLIKTNDIDFYIEGSFEIKRTGDGTPVVNVIANEQKTEFKEEASKAKLDGTTVGKQVAPSAKRTINCLDNHD